MQINCFRHKSITFFPTGRVLMVNSADNFTESVISLAICSQNCARIWKGRDQKTVVCRVKHKKCRANGDN